MNPGGTLEPDEITFAILLRGYGNQKPPAWPQITRLMTLMVSEHNYQPDIGKHPDRCFIALALSSPIPTLTSVPFSCLVICCAYDPSDQQQEA